MDYQLLYGERTMRSIANATFRDGIEFLQLAEKINIQSDVTVYPLKKPTRPLLDLNIALKGEAVLIIQ